MRWLRTVKKSEPASLVIRETRMAQGQLVDALVNDQLR